MSSDMRRMTQQAGTMIAIMMVFPLGFCVISGVFDMLTLAQMVIVEGLCRVLLGLIVYANQLTSGVAYDRCRNDSKHALPRFKGVARSAVYTSKALNHTLCLWSCSRLRVPWGDRDCAKTPSTWG